MYSRLVLACFGYLVINGTNRDSGKFFFNHYEQVPLIIAQSSFSRPISITSSCSIVLQFGRFTTPQFVTNGNLCDFKFSFCAKSRKNIILDLTSPKKNNIGPVEVYVGKV